MNEQKLPPYTRLKSILQEGQETLTSKAEKNLDELLGVKQMSKTNSNFINKILEKLKKIDNFIFKKQVNLYNTRFNKRSRK